MKQLKAMLSGQSRPMLLLVLTGVANAILILLLNRGYASLINAAIDRHTGGIAATGMALALAALANGAVNIAQSFLNGRIADNAGYRLRTAIAGHMLRAECKAMQGRNIGDSLSRVNQDLKQAVDWVRSQFCPMIIEATVLLATLSAMLAVRWELTVVAFVAVPFVTWFAVRASRPIRKAADARQAALARSNALVKSVMDAFPIIKIFDMAGTLQTKFGNAEEEAVDMAVRANGVERLLMTINGLSSLIPLGLLLGIGGVMVIGQTMTAGVLLAYINLSNYIVGPIMNLPNRISAARAFSSHIDRAMALTVDPVETDRLVNRRLTDMRNENAIQLGSVSFAYEESRPVLRHINMAVPEGGRVALVGPSGCGKSTVVKLLAALHMPQEGHVAVLGRDTRKWDLTDLRSRLAVVMQDPFLFPGSILENVTCGHEMPLDRVLAACKAAGLMELIESLPEGLDAGVGERGAKLSGGQKQRIAIARAIARDAPILLLDEATSALDAGTERDIQDALQTLMRGRTVLIVTHRLQSICDADRIYCMNGGRMAESGTHGELMAQNGLYASLYKVQNGFAEDPEGRQCI